MPTVTELKNELKVRGLPTHGKKAELEERLQEAILASQKNQQQQRGGGSAAAGQHKRTIPDSPTTTTNNDKKQRLQSPKVANKSSADACFESLSDGADSMDPEKTLAFCETLGIDPEASVAIGLSYYLKSPSMGTFDRAGFTAGMKELKVNDMASLKAMLPVIEKRTSWGGSDFDDVYKFAFGWGCEPGIRNLKKEVAISLWRLLVPKSGFALIDEWIQHWEDSPSRVVTKDEWLSFKRYADIMKNSTKVVETDDAWPIAIDDFVEKLKAKQ